MLGLAGMASIGRAVCFDYGASSVRSVKRAQKEGTHAGDAERVPKRTKLNEHSAADRA